MNSNTILSWDNIDHKAIYTRQLADNPIYWDLNLNIWVAYSYEYCKTVLMSDVAIVPEPVIEADSLLSGNAKLAIKKLARITNNMQHQESRAAAIMMFQCIRPVQINELIDSLLGKVNFTQFDFVTVIAKQLPVLVILKGMDFGDDDCAFVTENIAVLVRIMAPNKSAADVTAINSTMDEFYAIAKRYVNEKLNGYNEASIALFAVNLLGLFIQSYDAGRGLLCNSLINMVKHCDDMNRQLTDKSYFKRGVIETLRLDPPVHHTRRIAAENFRIGGQLIKAGEPIMVVIAAANLDPVVFADPGKYNPLRSNNDQHLTFGLGGHNCLAKYLTIDMATDVCSYLANKYPAISILQHEFKYEPLLNVRLVKELLTKLS
ncbi:cytochrome P450 [Mucilaginibacter sp. OK098]|uniref:cytochrome P450 n=1 Tax=Mucilaginibacter sp. OK098 TaxID=1855297 RepID=UPI0009328E86|nr:cytochrome P450 [Mucilaginibacter sp. OK098]